MPVDAETGWLCANRARERQTPRPLSARTRNALKLIRERTPRALQGLATMGNERADSADDTSAPFKQEESPCPPNGSAFSGGQQRL